MYLEYPNFCVFHDLGSIHVKASRFLSFAVWYNHIPRSSLTQLLLLFFFFFANCKCPKTRAWGDLGTRVVCQDFKPNCTCQSELQKSFELGRQGEREGMSVV